MGIEGQIGKRKSPNRVGQRESKDNLPTPEKASALKSPIVKKQPSMASFEELIKKIDADPEIRVEIFWPMLARLDKEISSLNQEINEAQGRLDKAKPKDILNEIKKILSETGEGLGDITKHPEFQKVVIERATERADAEKQIAVFMEILEKTEEIKKVLTERAKQIIERDDSPSNAKYYEELRKLKSKEKETKTSLEQKESAETKSKLEEEIESILRKRKVIFQNALQEYKDKEKMRSILEQASRP